MKNLKLFSCIMLMVILSFTVFGDVFEDSVTSDIYNASESFGIKVFKEQAKLEKDKNFIISPASLFFSFVMLYNGTSGETRKEFENLLELQGIKPQYLNEVMNGVIESFDDTHKKVKVYTASTMLINEKLKFQDQFLKIGEKYYDAELDCVDFQSSRDINKINNWVKKQTAGKIKKIITKPPPALTSMVLMNVVYFNGKWKEKFDKDRTAVEDFFVTPGKPVKVPMMKISGEHYPYYKGENFEAVALPYKGERFYMYIFLPNEDYSLKQLNDELTFENWRTWMKSFKTLKGEVEIPKFTMDFDLNLVDTLKNLGLNESFNQTKADFSKAAIMPKDFNMFIDQIKQKNYIQVDEEGTVAISLTFIMLGGMAVADDFHFRADRPFMFTIYDTRTRSILFMGNIYEP